MISLGTLKEMAEKCVRCGICQSVCPVFAELQREASVARGKIHLSRNILEGQIGYSAKLSTYLLQCLGCGACSENCPNGVQADQIILAMRAHMAEEKGLSLPKWLIFRVAFRSVHLLPMLLRPGSLLQGLALKKIPGESGLHLRFSLPYLDKNRLIPPIVTPFFLKRFPEEIKGVADANGQRRIGIFSGCSINYLFPPIGEAALHLLRRKDFSVIVPKEQTCCGLPAYGSGDIETARLLARRNLEVFSRRGIDSLLVPCDSCFYFLKEGYLRLFPQDEKVRAFSQRIIHPSTLFADLRFSIDRRKSDRARSGQDHPCRLTYHDPCHLRRGMKIFREPRKLLQSLPGVELVEMKQPDRCCGMGGSFNLVYYPLSRRILRHKLEDIEAVKPDAVVTGCMGCLIQLRDGLHQKATATKAMHLMEVLEKTLPLT